MGNEWTPEDIRQIEDRGLTVAAVESQMEIFRQGVSKLCLNRPCTVGDGVVSITGREGDQFTAVYDEAAQKGRCMMFVPASGAATRMFKDWYGILEHGFKDQTEEDGFFTSLPLYPFFKDLQACAAESGASLGQWLGKRKFQDVLDVILTARGLNYGNLPKALLKFHAYQDGSRTSLEEHLAEGAMYIRDANGRCRLHFTVSKEYLEAVALFLDQVKGTYENQFGVSFETGLSIQDPASDTIAADMKNQPFRDERGALVFRPAGHGSLLANLNGLNGDIVFIKNIDNIVPDRLKGMTVHYKKIMGGLLINLQTRIFRYLHEMETGSSDQHTLDEICRFCQDQFHAVFHRTFRKMPLWFQAKSLSLFLNKPLRVCGMVRNEGEPGGGPFWVEEANGAMSLQIVEEIQVDTLLPEQRDKWHAATHFNPVDLVTGIRNYRGEKFDLRHYVNDKAVTIAKKTEKGRELKALELPGLWNGAMAHWNTVFVELPVETFSPAKVISDLLRPQHQP